MPETVHQYECNKLTICTHCTFKQNYCHEEMKLTVQYHHLAANFVCSALTQNIHELYSIKTNVPNQMQQKVEVTESHKITKLYMCIHKNTVVIFYRLLVKTFLDHNAPLMSLHHV